MRTWFMPCHKHKFGKDSELIDSGHRWNMVQEVTNQYPDQMLAFDWEIARQFDGSMWTAMDELERNNGDQYDFHIVIGMDNANIVETKWHQGDFLVQRFPFIVIERAGVERSVKWIDEKQHTVIPFCQRISSSEIRECVAAGKHDFAKKHLNDRVWDYIMAGQLYGHQGG
jgi:nicotinic acid mononucleotide adenylyltransferase